MLNLYYGKQGYQNWDKLKVLYSDVTEQYNISRIINLFCKSKNIEQTKRFERNERMIMAKFCNTDDYAKENLVEVISVSDKYVFLLFEEKAKPEYKTKEEFIYDDLYHKVIYTLEYFNHKCNIGGMFLQGSQNYGLDVHTDDYKSDIDVKVILIPSLNDLMAQRVVNEVIVMPDNSHVECKDIREFSKMWYKANPSYLEILFTKYKLIFNNDIRRILKYGDDIVLMNENSFLNSLGGMIYQKVKNLEKKTPSTEKEIEDIGYVKKELHHICRLNVLYNSIYKNHKLFRHSLIPVPACIEWLIKLKTEPIELDEARNFAKQTCRSIELNIGDDRNKRDILINQETVDRLNEDIQNCIYNHVVTTIIQTSKMVRDSLYDKE